MNATFATTSSGGAGTVTHYILSAVPRDEIFEPVDGMADLIQDSTAQVGGKGQSRRGRREAKSSRSSS